MIDIKKDYIKKTYLYSTIVNALVDQKLLAKAYEHITQAFVRKK